MGFSKDSPDSHAVEAASAEAARIREDFHQTWVRQCFISGGTLVFLIPMIMAGDGPDIPGWVLLAGLVGVLMGLVGSLWNWRCPNCNTYFGKQFFGVRHCSSCGVALVE